MRGGDRDGDPKQMMWLSGPAGSGKTAIAGSVADTCKKAGILAASFFFSSFSGSADRHSKRCVVATIALHLAEHDALHDYKVQLLASIERHPNIFRKRLADQAEYLLLQPLRMLLAQSDRSAWPKGIVFDGLDEVLAEQYDDAKRKHMQRSPEQEQLEILNVLTTLVNDPAFPFRIFIASRPERIIDEFFSTAAKGVTFKLFLDSHYKPDADIKLFLCSRFADIRRRYGLSNTSWPGEEAIARIIEMSSGQFIVPATVIRHIEAGPPQRQLDDIVKLKWESGGRKNPLAPVDALYTLIFRRSPDPFLAAKWIRIYGSMQEQPSALFFKQLVEGDEGEFNHILGPLCSLVAIPSPDDPSAKLKIYHKSLIDFLSSKRRSGDLYPDGSSMEAFVADRCVAVLRSASLFFCLIILDIIVFRQWARCPYSTSISWLRPVPRRVLSIHSY